MKVSRIFHSGFLVETEEAYLLFDYFKGELPPLDPDKALFIFVSHGHFDHYSRKIFQLSHLASLTKYILSSEISYRQEMQGLDVVFVDAHQELEFHLADVKLKLRTLRSNDLGLAYIVELGGSKIYHAGDLNNWWWDGDEEDQELERAYHEELEHIKGEHFQLSFVPLDDRLKGYERGILDFLRYVSSDYLVPMHFEERFEIVDTFQKMDVFKEVREKTSFSPIYPEECLII